MLREHHLAYQRLEGEYHAHLKNEEIHPRHMKEKVAKAATRKKKKKTISLEDEPLSITNIVVRIWNVTDAMLTIK